jgi:uncharacterized membrane protein YkvA (DUF1232 family)
MSASKIKNFHRKAEILARNEKALENLSLKALEKAETQGTKLKGFWHDLMALIRLVRAWAKNEYRVIPWTSLVAAVGALAYFLNPFDFIPDLLFGFADDAFIIAWVLSSIKADLSVFLQWEAMNISGEI